MWEHLDNLKLYKTLDLPILQYVYPVWSPFTECSKNRLEGVQHRFFRYASFKLGRPMQISDHDYTRVSYALNVCTIENLYRYNDIMLAYKLQKDNQRCESLRDIFINRQLQHNLRATRVIREYNSSAKYAFFSTPQRLRRLWNTLPRDTLDATSFSLYQFKRKAKNLFNLVRFLIRQTGSYPKATNKGFSVF